MLTFGKSPISLLQEYCDKLKLPHPRYEYTKLYNQCGFNSKCDHMGRTTRGVGADVKSAKTDAALKMCLALKIMTPRQALDMKEVDEELLKDVVSEKSPLSQDEYPISYEGGNTLPAGSKIIMEEEHTDGNIYEWDNGDVTYHGEVVQDDIWYGLSRRMQLLEEREYRRERELESVLSRLRQFQQGYVIVLEDIQQALKGHQHAIRGQQKELEDLRGQKVDPMAQRLDDAIDQLSTLAQSFKDTNNEDVINYDDEDDLADLIREVDALRLRGLAAKEPDTTACDVIPEQLNGSGCR